MAGVLQHLGAGIVILVDAVAEAHEAERVVGVLGTLDELGDPLTVADLAQHLQHRLVRAAMRGTPERGDAGGDAGERIGARGARKPHRRGRGVLLVIGVQQENLIERLRHHRVDLVGLAGHREGHVQEVGGIFEVVARIHEGLADRVFVGHGRDGRHFRDQAIRGD